MSASAQMTGMSRASGRHLGADEHLKQSIGDVLSTPIGTRVMRRDYGSLLFELVDQPVNARTRLRLYAAVAVALLRWEPRIRVTRLGLDSPAPGIFVLTLEGQRTDTGTPTTIARLTLPIRLGGNPVLARGASA